MMTIHAVNGGEMWPRFFFGRRPNLVKKCLIPAYFLLKNISQLIISVCRIISIVKRIDEEFCLKRGIKFILFFFLNFSFIVLTTSHGIMDHEEARRKHTGGKVLGFFF